MSDAHQVEAACNKSDLPAVAANDTSSTMTTWCVIAYTMGRLARRSPI